MVVDYKGHGIGQITWAHPFIAMHFAQWVSVEFQHQMHLFFYRYIEGDISLVHDVADRVAEVHGKEQILTHSLTNKGTSIAEQIEIHAEVVNKQISLMRDEHTAALNDKKDEINALTLKMAAVVTENSTLTSKNVTLTTENDVITTAKAELAKLHEEGKAEWAKLTVVHDDKERALRSKLKVSSRLCTKLSKQKTWLASQFSSLQEGAINTTSELLDCALEQEDNLYQRIPDGEGDNEIASDQDENDQDEEDPDCLYNARSLHRSSTCHRQDQRE